MGSETAEAGGPAQEVARFLDEHGVAYELVEHEKQFTAAGEAQAAGIEPHDAAKALLVRENGEYLLAVIPASRRLDLKKLRATLEEHPKLRLATEDEIDSDFPAFELGAVPPLGPGLPSAEVVDRALLEHDRVLCNAGDHAHSLLLDPNEIVRVGGSRVADICED
jgi:Ala-tRNA(Pro) deacylase